MKWTRLVQAVCLVMIGAIVLIGIASFERVADFLDRIDHYSDEVYFLFIIIGALNLILLITVIAGVLMICEMSKNLFDLKKSVAENPYCQMYPQMQSTMFPQQNAQPAYAQQNVQPVYAQQNAQPAFAQHDVQTVCSCGAVNAANSHFCKVCGKELLK